jgi:hypothetical protein
MTNLFSLSCTRSHSSRRRPGSNRVLHHLPVPRLVFLPRGRHGRHDQCVRGRLLLSGANGLVSGQFVSRRVLLCVEPPRLFLSTLPHAHPLPLLLLARSKSHHGAGPALSSDYTSNVCPAGYYCPIRTPSSTSFQCPLGYYCAAQATAAQTTICPTGSVCPAGSGAPVPCAAGFFCATGASASAACTIAGYYCPPANATLATSNRCPAGFFCVAGATAFDTVRADSCFFSLFGASSH